MKRRTLALLLAGGLLGCAAPENAILEVRMRLPTADAQGTTRGFARVAVVGSNVAIEPEKRLRLPSEPFVLQDLDADGCNVRFSVVADDPRGDRAALERGRSHGLSIVVWFCPTQADCDSLSAPRWLFDFDRALWPSERTFFEAAPAGSGCSRWGAPVSTLPALQTAGDGRKDFDFSMRVGECDVLGCLDEASQPAADVGFCSKDGIHPCE